MFSKNRIEVKPNWYEHQPQAVQENERYKILWDFNIPTDHLIEARRPGMIVKDKETKFTKVIGFAIPFDTRENSKEVEKIEKYQDLAQEIKKAMGNEGYSHPSSHRNTWNNTKETEEEIRRHWIRDTG